MKSKFKWISIALLAAVLVFGLTGCPEPKPKPKPPVDTTGLALLTKLSLQNGATEMPAKPIDFDTWEDSANFSALDAEYTGLITIYSPTAYQGQITELEVSKDAMASIYFLNHATNKPAVDFKEFDDENTAVTNYPAVGSSGMAVIGTTNWHMYIKVENGDAVNYYRFKVELTATNANANVTKVTITQGEASVETTTLGTPGTDGFAGATAGSIGINSQTDGAAAAVTAATQISAEGAITSIRYGKSPKATANDIPTTLAATLTGPFADGEMIYIEVTAQSGAQRFYKIEIQKGRNANLASLRVTDSQGENPSGDAVLGTPAATWNADGIGTGSSIKPNSLNSTGAKIEAVAQDLDATIKVFVGSDASAPAFSTTLTGHNLVEGQFIWVEVTSGNGTINIYKVKIEYSNDASLIDTYRVKEDGERTYYYNGIIIDGCEDYGLGSNQGALTASTFTSLPVTATQGLFGFSIKYDSIPAAGLKVNVSTTDPSATVRIATGDYNKQVSELTWTSIPNAAGGGGNMLKPASEDHKLYVEVTAANGTTKAYYVGRFEFVKAGIIYYGTPEIRQNYIDPIWDTVEDYYDIVTRTNSTSENTTSYRALTDTNNVFDISKKDQFTWGRAKALWDETGVYVYTVVAKHTGTFFFGIGSSQEHTYDSVEVFINERVDASGNVVKNHAVGGINYSNRGGQYRLSPSAAMPKSGDPSITTTGFDSANFPVSGWTILASDPVALKNSAGQGRAGYVTIFKVPFRFAAQPWVGTGTPDSGTGVDPAAPWPVKDGKKIGLDLQINVCQSPGGTTASRMGVMVWKNTTGSNYRDCSSWGEATLVGGKIATITTQPQSATYIIDTATAPTMAPLTVAATLEAGVTGPLAFQWFKVVNGIAAEVTAADGSGGNTNTFTPSLLLTNNAANLGTFIYYCRLTAGTISMLSGAATITVKGTDAAVPSITTQPVAFNYDLDNGVPGTNDSVSVVAASTDGGTLSYQWYSATAATASGTLITSATLDAYAPTKVLSDLYYYVVVTNTLTGKLGVPASITSDRARGQFTGTDTKPPTWKTLLGENASTTPPPITFDANTETDVAKITMTVEAELPTDQAGGSLSYQWYYATNASTTTAASLTLVEGATSASYTPPLTATFTNRYYYCIATNTNNSVTGAKTASTLNTAAAFPRQQMTISGTNLASITTQPKASTTYDVSGASPSPAIVPLTVVTAVTGDTSATFNYQWYEASAVTGGTTTAISGATGATFNPPATAFGLKFYYVTATVNATTALGIKNTVTSSRVAVCMWKPGEIYLADFGDQPTFTTNPTTDSGNYGGISMKFNFPASFEAKNYSGFNVVANAYSNEAGTAAITTGTTIAVSCFLSIPDPEQNAGAGSSDFITNQYGAYGSVERVQAWTHAGSVCGTLAGAGITTPLSYGTGVPAASDTNVGPAAIIAKFGTNNANPYNIRFERNGSSGTLRSLRIQYVWFIPVTP